MTRRCSHNWICQAAAALAVMGTLLAGGPAPARADARSYANTQRQIKACVIVSNAASYLNGGVLIPENAVPYVFYLLDRRTDLKPAGWSFVNPIANSTVTGSIRQRWIARDTGATDSTLANPAFALGAPLTKNIGAYWEVNLDSISQTDLQQFDIVLLAYHTGATAFSPNERDMLRKYVDAGGTVWLEDEGGFDINTGGNHAQNQFIIDTAFNGPVVNPATPPSLATFHHPIVNFPFPLSSVTIQALGSAGQGVHHIALDPILGDVNPRVVVPVVWSGAGANNNPLVYAGDYGAGHIVVSSAGIATGINSYAGGAAVAKENGNSGAVSGENTLGVQITDAEFAINMIAWTSTVSTGGFNARRTGGSQEDIGFGLSSRWANVPPVAAPTSVDSGATIYKNCTFYVDGYNILHCYDLSPGEDLDGDGNPDDGLVDYINGSPYDEVWNVDLKAVGGAGFGPGTRFSAPTIFSVNNGGTIVDQLAVQGSNGVTAVFNAFTMTAGGTLAPTPQLLYTVIGAGGNGGGNYAGALVNQHGGQALAAPCPAYSDGVLFSLVYDSKLGVFTEPDDAWHIFPTDPLTGQNIFFQPKTGVAPSPQMFGAIPLLGMPMPVGSITAGFITDYTTGAQDKIIYTPTLPDLNVLNSGGGNQVCAELFSVKNEPLLDISGTGYANPSPAPGTQFRATLSRGNIPWFLPALPWGGIRSMLPVCHRTSGGVVTELVYDPTGATANSFSIAFVQDPSNSAEHQVLVIPNPSLLPGDTLAADYTVDWPGAPLPNGAGTNTLPVARDFVSVNVNTKISNPYGNSPGVTPMFFTGGLSLSPDDMCFVNVGDAPFADRIYAMNNHFSVANATVPGTTKPEGPAVRWMFFPNGPVPDEGPLTGAQGLPARFINTDTFNSLYLGPPMVATDLESIGTPTYSNGVTYQVGWCHMQFQVANAVNEWDAALIVAYRANPVMTFVPKNADGTVVQIPDVVNQRLQLKQVDIVHYVPGQVPIPTITLTENTQFTVDHATSTISIYDCRQSVTGDCFNLAEPFTLYQSGQVLSDPQLNTAGYGLLDNVLWWMLVPIQDTGGANVNINAPPVPGLADVRPASGVSVIGNTLYYGTQHGNIASVDLTGMPQNGSQAMLYRPDGTPRMRLTPALFDTTTNLAVDLPLVNPPVGTTDVVVATSPKGINALDNGLTLITDNVRLIQVDAAVEASWTMESTQTQTLVGGPLAGVGNIAAAKISLARPNMAIHDSIGTFIVADSGNNRVMETNMGGVVSWEIHSFNNGLQFLRPGDPITLNHPTGVQTYTLVGNGPVSFTSPITGAVYNYNGYYYSYHYLIADSGNSRDLEIVDIYDATGAPIVMTAAGQPNVTMTRQLIFVTKTLSEQNRLLRYRTVQQFVSPAGGLFMASVVDNAATGGVDPNNPAPAPNPPSVDSPGGSVLIFSRSGGANDGAIVSRITGIYDPKRGTHTAIAGPTYFKEYTAVGNTLHYLLCDANGCYDLVPGTALNGAQNGEAVVTWALYSTDYLTMTGRPLRAASIQKLGKADYYTLTNLFYPHYLITNRYTGDDNIVAAFGGGAPLLNVATSQIRGEVVEVRGDVYYNTTTYPQGYITPAARLYVNSANLLYPQNPLTSAIVWMAPKESWQLKPPALPIQRKIGTVANPGTNSFIIEQPTFSDRPY